MRREFDPLEWFASLDARGRAEVVREVADAFERMEDPGLGQATAIWRRGKTARVEVLIPSASPLPFGVHLSVQDGDPRLLANFLDRARRGDLEFGTALVEGEGGSREGGLAASMGVGSLVVTSRLGELVVQASPGQRLSVPVSDDVPRGRAGVPFLVGSRFPISIPEQEGFVLLPFEGQLVAIGQFARVTPRDARLFGTAPARVGLALPSPNLMLLCLEIRGFTDGWMEMPFALGIEPPERRLDPPDAQGRMALVALLVDRADGSIRVVRPVPLSKAFTAALLDAVEAQQDAAGGYDRSRYAADYEAAQRRWPTPNHVERDMVAKELVRAP